MAADDSVASADAPSADPASQSKDEQKLEQTAQILKELRPQSDLPPHAEREALAVQAAQEREAQAIKAAEEREKHAAAAAESREKIALEGFNQREARAKAAGEEREARAATIAAQSEVGKVTLILLAVLSLLSWILMFSSGLLVSSKKYREALGKEFHVGDFIRVLLTYTPTNVLCLTLIAAFAGGASSRLLYWNIDADPQLREEQRYLFLRESPFSSMLRGFAVFLAFLGGIFITADAPFAEPTPGQYARVAGLVSLLAFIMGYDPTFFKWIVGAVKKAKTSREVEGAGEG